MPEGPEAEIARRALAPVVGRSVRSFTADDRCAGPGLDALVDERVLGVRRHGKLVLVDTSGPVLGIHFGMTGRVIVDGAAPIERLEYGSGRDDPAWDRLVVQLDVGGFRVNDPRRWSRFELDPDPARWGPDVFSLSEDDLTRAVTGRRAIKSVLLDQSKIAGLGNLCVDEVLFHAELDPAALAATLSASEVSRLHDAIVTHVPAMLERGGSHTGIVSPAARAGLPACPRCAGPLIRTVVGGRTTVSCSNHQRGGRER